MKFTLPLLSIFSIWTFLAIFSFSKHPLPEGNPSIYWEFACGVEVKNFQGYFPFAKETGIIPYKDGWHLYYFREHHGRHLFKIKKENLEKSIPELFLQLDTEITSTIQKPSRYDDLEAKNTRRVNCQNIRNTVNSNPNQFLDALNIDAKNQTYQFQLQSFYAQLDKAKLFWVAILFEAIFLPFWVLFTFHPGTLGKLNTKSSVRIAFAPLILFIPYFLGYSTFLFSAGASGGILYPLFAIIMSLPFFWVPFNPLDLHILKMVPQPLTIISQIPAAPAAVSFYGAISPTVIMLYSIMVLFVTKIIKNKLKKEK